MKQKLLSIVTAVTLLTNYSSVSAQAPSLGSAADFVLFTTNGALTNTGASKLTGDVGSNNGSSTGFGNVNGIMQNNNGATAQAAADLLTAYNNINTTTATFFPAPLLGNGQSLNAGVYSISGNSTLTNTLTLNAQSNANAVFIFKIQGTFSAAAGSKIILLNGAQACNVFWKVEGAVSLASGTTMKGNIIANNAAISMSSNTSLEGRALTTAGAITINNVLAYTPTGCGSPYLTGPAAPAMVASACYAIFSGNGPVTNSGTTYVIGDVGTNVGLTTGYQAINVTGAIHPIPDGSTAACATDLLSVYNYLNTLAYDIELLYPAQFGNNLVLTPHVYRMNGATTFNDTLFLNGEGNANAVFVIQVNGALSSSTFAKVSLTNGTQAKNVFWKVEGAVNLNNNADFVGTMVVNNGAINLNTGVKVTGRALTTNGSLSTSAVTVNMPAGCGVTPPAASITTQPSNKTACVGSTVKFSVGATGAGITYQWRKGTTNLTNGGNISGATTATLTISPVSAADAATNYNVLVIGSTAPSATSTSASLVVNTLPQITTQPVSQIGCIDATVSFSVVAGGTGIVYQWRKGIINLVNGADISGATTATLTISSMNATDTAGNYNVKVSGACLPDKVSNNAALTLCSTTVGINTLQKNVTAITVYPNPFTSSFEVILKDVSPSNNSNLIIYNILGVEVLAVPINKQSTLIDGSLFPAGVYFYNLIGNDKIIQSGKLISRQ